MEELLKAITNLINTGGSLADDALYLYFAMKMLTPFAVTSAIVGSVWVICRCVIIVNGYDPRRRRNGK